MAFSTLLIGLVIIKAIMLWMFYSRLGMRPIIVGIIACLAWFPILTILYHETNFDFWLILLILIIADVFMYNTLLQKKWVKSILLSVFLNLFAMIFFLFVNG